MVKKGSQEMRSKYARGQTKMRLYYTDIKADMNRSKITRFSFNNGAGRTIY